MINRWYRIGNFFEMKKNSFTGLGFLFNEKNPVIRQRLWDKLSVTFKNYHTNTVTFRAEHSDTIREIHITRNFGGEIKLTLVPVPSKKHLVRQACQKLFKDQLDPQEKDSISIKLPSGKFDADSVLKSLTEVAKGDLSNSLLSDINKILNYIPNIEDLDNAKNLDNRHKVSDGRCVNSHVNPYRKNSRGLLRLFERNSSFEEIINDFMILLTKGEDVDQEEGGRSALWWAICQTNVIFLRLLLWYGANPIKRPGYDGYTFTSAREFTQELQDLEKLDIIDSFLFPSPSQSLNESPDKVKLTILSQFLTGRREYLQSVFLTDSKLITALTIPVKDFSSNQKYADIYQELFILFANTFKTPDGDAIKLRAIFDDDIVLNKDCSKQWITLVFEKDIKDKGFGKLIGCNRFDLLRTDKLPVKYNDHLVMHWVFSLADTCYRGNRLMPTLFQLFSVGMQLVNPKKKVAVVFSSIHPSSYHMVKGLRHAPKYLPDHVPELLQAALKLIYKNGMIALHHYNGTMTWYFKEPATLQVIGPKLPSDKLDPITQFFKQILSGSIENVAVPVAYYASDSTFSLSKSLYSLGLKNYVEVISRYSQAIMRFVHESQGFANTFPRGPLLFFGNENPFDKLETVPKAGDSPQALMEHAQPITRIRAIMCQMNQ